MTTTDILEPDLIASWSGRARRHDVDWQGGTVCWRQFGDGPPLVLLHGGHGSWLHWIRNLEALSARHSLWVADLPGYGDSDNPGSRTDKTLLLDATQTTLDRLVGASTPIDLAGFSFGSLMGAHLAVSRPGVRRFALMGAAGHGGPRRPRGELRTWKEAAQDPDPAVLAGVMRHNLSMHMLHAAPEAIDTVALQAHTVSCRLTRFRSKEISRSGGLQALLAACPAEVMLVWGEHDVTAHPQVLARELVDGHPRRRAHIVPDAGHWVQYEGADEVNRLMLDWLDGPPRA